MLEVVFQNSQIEQGLELDEIAPMALLSICAETDTVQVSNFQTFMTLFLKESAENYISIVASVGRTIIFQSA